MVLHVVLEYLDDIHERLDRLFGLPGAGHGVECASGGSESVPISLHGFIEVPNGVPMLFGHSTELDIEVWD